MKITKEELVNQGVITVEKVPVNGRTMNVHTINIDAMNNLPGGDLECDLDEE